MKRIAVLGALLSVLLACALSASPTTYQPDGSHVVYGDGSTLFYYKVTNPSNGQVKAVNAFFNCKAQVAVIEFDSFNMPSVPVTMTCLTPPNGGAIEVTGGGSVQYDGMTVTVNPSSWTIARGRGGEYVVTSSINVPLTVQ